MLIAVRRNCFRDHCAQVLAFLLRRVSGREAAEDVVADTFAVAWRRRDRIPDPALPWLYVTAAHVIANQYRDPSPPRPRHAPGPCLRPPAPRQRAARACHHAGDLNSARSDPAYVIGDAI